MTPARDKLKDYIEKVQISQPKISFVSNVDAKIQSDPKIIKENLITQVNSKTLWEESIKVVSVSGVKLFIEIGPGQILKGLSKKIDPKLEVKNIGTVIDIQSLSSQIPTSPTI